MFTKNPSRCLGLHNLHNPLIKKWGVGVYGKTLGNRKGGKQVVQVMQPIVTIKEYREQPTVFDNFLGK